MTGQFRTQKSHPFVPFFTLLGDPNGANFVLLCFFLITNVDCKVFIKKKVYCSQPSVLIRLDDFRPLDCHMVGSINRDG